MGRFEIGSHLFFFSAFISSLVEKRAKNENTAIDQAELPDYISGITNRQEKNP
jgi:hypothetical protein